MEIKHIHKINKEGSKTKAFFAVETKNFIIYDIKLVEGANGLFVSMPSREYLDKKTNQKKFQPIIWVKDLDFIKAINEEAVKVYNGGSNAPDEDIPF